MLLHWPIDYLSYLKHFQSQTNMSYSLLVDLDWSVPLTPKLKQYFDGHDLASEYDTRSPTLLYDFDAQGDDPSGRKVSHNTVGHLSIDIHRELSWTLCCRILDQIKSIAIPLSDVDRYLDVAHQMISLQSITFRMDEVDDTHDWHGAEERLDAAVMEKLALAKTKRLEDLESAVEFVQLHTLLFPGTLAHVECPTHFANVGLAEQVCPYSFYRRMVGAIKVRNLPTELMDKNWKEFTVNVENTDLSQVQIMYVFGRETDWYYPLQATPFLHLCTALKVYMMISLRPDSFKWAVKKDSKTVLPPLEIVDIQAVKEPFGSELEDVGQGFGKTLKAIKAAAGTLQLENNVQTISIGRGCDMPLLRVLSVRVVSERLVLDPSLLSHYRELRCLDLSDNLRSYDVREIQSTKLLKTLVLGSHGSFNQSFLPSVHRTLDTNLMDTLTLLETLDLSVEFALHSQFRMLQSTPSLKQPYLTILSNMPALERVLTDANFTLPPGASQSAGSSGFLLPQELDKIPIKELGEILLQIQCLKDSIAHPHEAPQHGGIDRGIPSEAQQLLRRMDDLRMRQWGYTSPKFMHQQQIYDKKSSELHGLVAASPVLKRVHDTLMAARVRYYEKQATKDAITAVFQSEHPDRLVEPSLKTLELNGRWVISDDVLETMLGQVFVNVESVDLFGCEGFGTRTWIRATAATPFLKSASVNRVLEVETAADFGLQSHAPRGTFGRALFETETRKRLDYTFVEGSYSFAEGADVE
ncbi:hypothetical protein BG006_006998 [Podila minutissima]|uniref:Uncharacterized protein n=1 Tax=Podila minutissima TaxID=64525 RepID=A0A9P5SV32_9FUNG|nr:hypothetical protein BG006_006998 [Podila minutissima]